MRDNNINKVREFAIGHAKLGEHTIHGIDHWDRVARNGESLNVLGQMWKWCCALHICMMLSGNQIVMMWSMAQGQQN